MPKKKSSQVNSYKPIHLIYRDKPVIIEPSLSRQVLTDDQGRSWTTWWPQPDNLPKTPAQRAKYGWTADQIAYRCFEDGIVSLQRSLMHAMIGGKQRVLTLEEVEDLRQKTDGKIAILKSDDPDAKIEIAWDIVSMLKGIGLAPKKQNLKEANEQLHYILTFRDKNGQLNRGVLICKSSIAVSSRIREQLHSIEMWSADYSGRLALVTAKIEEFYRALDKFENALLEDITELKKMDGQINEKYFATRLDLYQNYFVKWIGIRPFRDWSMHTYNDIESVRMKIRFKFNDRIIEDLERMLNSCRFKKEQKHIDNIIFALSHDMPYFMDYGAYNYAKPLQDYAIAELVKIQNRLNEISDKGFASPGLEEVKRLLFSIRFSLGTGFTKLSGQFEIKKQLKKLSSLM
jgi:hypothetical protein